MKKFIRIGILSVVCASLIVGYYFYLSHGRSRKDEGPKEMSELEKVLTVDFAAKYPQTPREVMKWYDRIVMLYYGGEASAGQIELLCDQAMMLFDADLIQANPRDMYISSVKAEINTYKTRNKRMIKADVCDTSDVAAMIIRTRIRNLRCARTARDDGRFWHFSFRTRMDYE